MDEPTRDFTREPVGRFEWERVFRRVIVSTPSVKLVGLALATYASTKTGADVRPGVDRLVNVTGTSRRVVMRALSELKELGLLDQLTRGGNLGRASHGMASIYRLTLPTDLLENVPLLDPDEQKQVPPVAHSKPEDVPLLAHETADATAEDVPMAARTCANNDVRGASSGTLPLQEHLHNEIPLQKIVKQVTLRNAHEENLPANSSQQIEAERLRQTRALQSMIDDERNAS